MSNQNNKPYPTQPQANEDIAKYHFESANNQDQPPPYTEPGQVQINTSSNNPYDSKQANSTATTANTNVYIAPIPQANIIPIPPGAYVTIAPARLRDRPVQTNCQFCTASVVSRTKYETGIATWMVAGGICLFGLWCGCCLIPFCVDGFKDVEHYCPNCKALMGRFKRI